MDKNLEMNQDAEAERTKEEMEITPAGVGLYKYEWDEIAKIAEGYNLTKHNLAVYGLRYFIKQLKAGNVPDLPVEKHIQYKLPKP